MIAAVDMEFDFAGTRHRGLLYRPAGVANPPVILVAHEAPGLGDHMRRRGEMLADLGYAAFVADLHGEGRILQGAEVPERLRLLRSDPALFRDLMNAAYAAMVAIPNVDVQRTAAVGYCFGGGAVLELARSGTPLRGVITFHGWLRTEAPARPGDIRTSILACTGADDELVPADHVLGFQSEMSEAGADWQVITYAGARHAFTNRDADRLGNPVLAYNARADARSWSALRTFLEEVFA